MNVHGHTLNGPSRLETVRAVPRAAFAADSLVVGRNPRMRAIVDFVNVIADSDSSVLITGETGTGKEVIANLLHASSARRHKPFVPVSCAIFSETLIESELFGHERGAFTWALKASRDNKSKAAELLNIKRSTLGDRLKKSPVC